jgi:hypothetical protein
MLSDRKVTREVKLTLLHLNHGLLVSIALSYSGVRSLLLGLDPPRVWALLTVNFRPPRVLVIHWFRL